MTFMNHNEYRELLSLADALNFICESELLSSLLKKEGLVPNSFDFDVLVRVVADAIHKNLTE